MHPHETTTKLRRKYKKSMLRQMYRFLDTISGSGGVIISLLFAMTAFSSCTNIDCPLSNSVSAKYMFYDSSSRASVVLKDTLTVKAREH